MQTRITDPYTRKVYEYVLDCFKEYNCPPTIREISDACFISRTTAMRHLELLEARGLILREPKRARGIRLPKEDDG